MSTPETTLGPALRALAAGEVVVLRDLERERADLIAAAELVGPETVALMARIGRGIVAVALRRKRCAALGLVPMPATPGAPVARDGALPLVSVEAREGVSTGISASDRALTIRTLATSEDPAALVAPGHVFPVPADDGGLLARVGRAEAAVDAVALAGCRPVAAICDLLDERGALAGPDEAVEVAASNGLRIVERAELAELRFESQWQTSVKGRKAEEPHSPDPGA